MQLFNPSYNKDRFENTALTVNGHVGSLELLYAGSYLVRNVEQQEDYTAYSHAGFYVDYYQCINFSGNPYTADPNAQCFTPSAYWRDRLRNTHQSHELRVTTPAGARVRAVGGLFYERYTTQDQLDWYYLTAIPYFNPIGPPTGDYMLNGQVVCGCTQGAQFVPGLGVTATNPNVRPPGDGFFNDVTRGYTQSAAYSSLDFELIPSVLTLTAGTRYYRTTSMEVGATVTSFRVQFAASQSTTRAQSVHQSRVHQPQRAGPASQLFRLQEPRQPQLETRRAGTALLHVVARVPPRSLQPWTREHRLFPPERSAAYRRHPGRLSAAGCAARRLEPAAGAGA